MNIDYFDAASQLYKTVGTALPLPVKQSATSAGAVAVSTPAMAALGQYAQISPYGTSRISGEPSTDRITDMIAIQKTGGASVACAGGIYDAAAKGGNAIVGVVQSWVTLAAGVIVSPTIAAVVATALLNTTPILSLTTGSTAACTADIFIFGYCVD